MKTLQKRFPAYLFVFCSLLLAAISCDEDSLTVKVPITKTFNITIDSTGFKSAEKMLYQSTVALNLDSLIKAYGGDPEMIKKGNVKSVTLTIISPTNLTFNFVNSLRVTAQKGTASEAEIATAQNTTPLAKELTFVIAQSQDVLSYIQKGSSFVLRLYGNTNPPLPVKQAGLQLKVGWEISVGLI